MLIEAELPAEIWIPVLRKWRQVKARRRRTAALKRLRTVSPHWRSDRSRPRDELARSTACRHWRPLVGLEMPTFAPRALPPVAETPRCACGKMADLQLDRRAPA